MKRAIVVGAGFGGLALAIRLQSAGVETTIVEARDKPGGRAYFWQKDGFTFDAGPTVITDPQALRELWGLTGRDIAEDVELLPVQPFYRLNWRDGTSFDYSNDDAQLHAEIARLNRIRKAHPALHSHLGVTFYNSSNDQVMAYGKALPSHEDMIFAVVNLDPHQPQETSFEIPLWEWKLPDSGALTAEDLMTGRTFTLHGKRQWLRLDPGVSPFALWRLYPGSAA